MALKFRLRGLAETFIDTLACPGCGAVGSDDDHFSTEETRVTFDGIVVVVTCHACHEVFVPRTQRLGVVDPTALREAVIQDSQDTGEPVLENLQAVQSFIEHANADRNDDIH